MPAASSTALSLERWLLDDSSKAALLRGGMGPPPAPVAPPMLPLSGPLRHDSHVSPLELSLLKGLRVQICLGDTDSSFEASMLWLGFDKHYVLVWWTADKERVHKWSLAQAIEISCSEDATRVCVAVPLQERLYIQGLSEEDIADLHSILNAAWRVSRRRVSLRQGSRSPRAPRRSYPEFNEFESTATQNVEELKSVDLTELLHLPDEDQEGDDVGDDSRRAFQKMRIHKVTARKPISTSGRGRSRGRSAARDSASGRHSDADEAVAPTDADSLSPLTEASSEDTSETGP